MVDLSKLEPIKSDGDLENERKKQEAISYLKSTDWYVIRKVEIGEEIPDEVKTKRAEAREAMR